MTEFNCPRCEKEKLGTIQDQATRICLDCGQCDGNRRGRELKDHEDRVKRMKLLLKEINKLNRNIREDTELDREERLINLLHMEVEYYFEWVAEEADIESMRQRQKYTPGGRINRQNFRGELSKYD